MMLHYHGTPSARQPIPGGSNYTGPIARQHCIITYCCFRIHIFLYRYIYKLIHSIQRNGGQINIAFDNGEECGLLSCLPPCSFAIPRHGDYQHYLVSAYQVHVLTATRCCVHLVLARCWSWLGGSGFHRVCSIRSITDQNASLGGNESKENLRHGFPQVHSTN